MGRRLRVVVDGSELAEQEARELWQRFSAWMDRHHGDLAGFARAESLASVFPEVHDGEPVLVASRTTSQRDYTTAPRRATTPAARAERAPGSGSRPAQRRGAPPAKSRPKAR